MITACNHPIRVGMITMTDLDDPDPISGMPYRMAQSLREQGIEIVPIRAWKTHTQEMWIPRKASNRIIRIHRRRTPMWIKRMLDNLLPGRTRSAVLRRVSALSHITQQNLDTLLTQGDRIDAIFGCCISSAMYTLETDIPIVYFSDATSNIIQATYPMLALRGQSFREALFEIEKASVVRVNAAIFATPSTKQSAIDNLGVPASMTSIVAMGAHVVPSDPDSVIAPATHPSKQSCKLLIVAADPIRKRVDLATDAAEILRERGINATLFVVGPGTKRSRRSNVVQSVGQLKLSDPDDRIRHQELLRDCHLQLLPSLGEAFGISPCESAHFARPSIVSNAGGLSFVVRDGETGIVLDVDANASIWADAIESLIDDPQRYQAMSTAALDRARSELNWTSWSATIRAIIDEQIAGASQRTDQPEIPPRRGLAI